MPSNRLRFRDKPTKCRFPEIIATSIMCLSALVPLFGGRCPGWCATAWNKQWHTKINSSPSSLGTRAINPFNVPRRSKRII